MRTLSSAATVVVAAFFTLSDAQAGLIVTLYGDNDGFGIGKTSGTGFNPDISHASSDAPFTDVRLIGNGFAAGAFAPTGSFSPFTVIGPIIAVTLTLRTGNFYPVGPADSVADHIFLNGSLVPDSFIAGFSDGTLNGGVETRSVALDPSFFLGLAGGNASLNGTHLAQGDGLDGLGGGGSFQVDYLELDITTGTGAVPEPASFALAAVGLVAVALLRRYYSITSNCIPEALLPDR